MASLRELQYSFAAALRHPGASCAVTPAANLDVYRHHGESQFAGVLAMSFPVLRRRVGTEYFRQLAHFYRRAHPSRSGDLQWVGRHFASFLDQHLRDPEYRWLADLARLEWLRELAAIAERRPALPLESLARHSADHLERLTFRLQPSLGMLRSDFPVFSVWDRNQVENAPPMEQTLGAQQGMVLGRGDEVVLEQLPPDLFSFMSALLEGKTLGDAMSAADLDEPGLVRALQFLFAQGVVCGVTPQEQGLGTSS